MNLLPVLVIVIVIAFLTGSDTLYYLTYALGGLLLFSFLWMRQAPLDLHVERKFPARAFHGEQVSVELVVRNRGRWPILWLHLHESIPLSLHVPNFVRRAVSLAPGERATVQYPLQCKQRGYYQLGPARLRTGDLFGLVREREITCSSNPFIVYPRVVVLRHLGLTSQLPYGELHSQQRMFQDPSRFFGTRAYKAGDSLREIDWKSSARTDQLQVKRFQPAIALNTLIILNLNLEQYSPRGLATAGEMGIVVAASMAAHLSERRQAVGLVLLGRDALTEQVGVQIIPPGRGREHLMRLLETLARAEMAAAAPLVSVLDQATADLGWGSSVVIITPAESERIVDALLQIQRRGAHVMLVITDPEARFPDLRAQLKEIGIPAFRVTDDQGMDVWR